MSDAPEDEDEEEDGDDGASIRERAAEMSAELDRWETSEDAGEDRDLAELIDDLEKWQTSADSERGEDDGE